MNYNKYNPRCNNGMKWSCGDDGVVHEDGVDDDPDEACGDDDYDGDDFPSPGRNFPGSFLPAGEPFLSLSLSSFRLRGGGGIFLRSVLDEF